MRPRLRSVLATIVVCCQAVQLAAQTSVPSAPLNFRGSSAGVTITLAWDPPATGAPIHYYVLELGVQSGVYISVVPVGPITTVSFDGVTGEAYYFRVSAVNALGPGPPSPEVAVVVGAPQVPSQPQQVMATAVGSNLTLSWEEPAFGAPITDYVVEFGMAPGVYMATGRVGLITSITLPAVPVGVYFFRVTAINAFGAGAPSPEVSGTVGIAVTLPGAPQNLSAGATYNGLVFAWSPPAEGAPITDYLFEIGFTPGVYVYSASVGPVTSFAIPGSIGAGAYYFRVTATNALGQGPPSVEAGVMVGGTPQPSAPQNVKATTAGSSITLSWVAPTFGAPFIDYAVEFGFAPGVYAGAIRTGAVTSLSVPGVPVGVYFFRVTAFNAYGQGTPGSEVRAVVGVPATLPGAPQNLSAGATYNGLTFAWNPPSDGAPITDYLFEIGFTPGVYVYSASVGPVTSLSIPGGVGAGTYYFRVTATNELGQGPPSAEVAFTIGGIPVPSAPQNVTATAVGPGITVSWVAPAFGTPYIDYVLEYGFAPGAYAGAISMGLLTSFTAPSVPAGVYFFRVTARNAYGLGTPSSEVRVYSGPPCTVPGPPQLSGSASGNQISLAWTTPSGGPITGYTLRISTPGAPGSTTGDLGLVNAIAGQAASGTYVLRVAAQALCGAGPASNQVTITVP